MDQRASTRQRGFTLIEVLVAMVILATTYGVLLKIFGSSIRNTARVEDYRAALVVAESTLAFASTDEHATPDGVEGGKFRWHVRRERLPGAMPADYVGGDGPGLVVVTVEWDSATGNAHQVQLSTIRLSGRLE